MKEAGRWPRWAVDVTVDESGWHTGTCRKRREISWRRDDAETRSGGFDNCGLGHEALVIAPGVMTAYLGRT